MIDTSRGARAALAAALSAALLSACAPPPSTTGAGDMQRSVRDAIANERALRADTMSVRTIGVSPLQVATGDTAVAPLAYGLADILMTDLARSSFLRVVDRVRLNTVLDELQLVSAGRVDSTTAPRVGRIVGARRLVLGTLADAPGQRFAIDAHIVDVADGTVRPVVTTTAPLADILAAEKELVFRLFTQLGVTLTPQERATISERETQNLAALLAYSRAVRYETEARFDDAATEYSNATRLDPAFSLAAQRLHDVEQRQTRGTVNAAMLNVLSNVNRFDAPPPLSARGAADPAFPISNGTLIIIITATP